MDKITISIADAANKLSISRSTVYELINKGELHAIKLGRRTLITMTSINARIKSAPRIGDICGSEAA